MSVKTCWHFCRLVDCYNYKVGLDGSFGWVFLGLHNNHWPIWKELFLCQNEVSILGFIISSFFHKTNALQKKSPQLMIYFNWTHQYATSRCSETVNWILASITITKVIWLVWLLMMWYVSLEKVLNKRCNILILRSSRKLQVESRSNVCTFWGWSHFFNLFCPLAGLLSDIPDPDGFLQDLLNSVP